MQFIEQTFARIKVDETNGAASVSSATYTVTAADSLLLCNTTSTNITLTLPEVSTSMVSDKFEVIVKKTAAANTLTVATTGSDLLDGSATASITTIYTALHLRAITGGWAVI